MKNGFFTTALRMAFVLMLLGFAWKATTHYMEKKETAERRVAIELFLHDNLSAEKFGEYVLIRDGIMKTTHGDH